MIHVAVLLKPYLDMILRGEKSVECRLTMQARDPYERLEPGERIYFKQSAGPYSATAIVEHALFESDLTPGRIRQIKSDYNHLIRGEDEFWRAKRDAQYCSLIWLRDVRPCASGPHIRPLQGVAWLCLDEEPAWRRSHDRQSADGSAGEVPVSFAVTITAGNIKNNTLYVTDVVDRFPAECIGGKSRDDAGKAVTLVLHQGPTVHTDIVGPRKLVRSRVWGKWFRAHRARPGDRVLFTTIDETTFHVGLIRDHHRGSS